MGALFRRDKPIRPAFQAPSAELLDLAAIEMRVAEVDARLKTISEVPPEDRVEGLRWQLDRLLDMRNAIRPARPSAVPVMPGRAEASIRNYGENPW